MSHKFIYFFVYFILFFYLLDHWFIIKGYNSGTARGKRSLGQGAGEGRTASVSSPGAPLSPDNHLHKFNNQWIWIKSIWVLEFPGGPTVRTWHFHCWGSGVQSLVGKLRSPQAAWHGQKKKSIWTFIMLFFQLFYRFKFFQERKHWGKFQ